MEFNRFVTNYDTIRKNRDFRLGTRGEDRIDLYYRVWREDVVRRLSLAREGIAEVARVLNAGEVEKRWLKSGRPYYNIYPGILPFLLRLDLSKVPTDSVEMPLKQLAFRLPSQDHSLTAKFFAGPNAGRELPVSAMLVGFRDLDSKEIKKAEEEYKEVTGKPFPQHEAARSLMCTYQFEPEPGRYCYVPCSLYLPDGISLDEAIRRIEEPLKGGDMEFSSLINLLRVIVTSLLLSTDVEDKVVTPDFDPAKLGDRKQIDRLKQNQQYGWNIGKHMEVSPHWRGPSPLALYWTGPGRKTPKYRYRRGTIVHREKLEEIPAGKEGDVEKSVVLAHTHAANNRNELQISEECGCFYCLRVFSPEEIVRWTGDTAICPHCGIDSVLGEASGFPIAPDFLNAMRDYWFGH